MKNEENAIEQTKAAFNAISLAVGEVLGENPDRDQLCELALLIAHASVTLNGQIPLELAAHNTHVFCERLVALVRETQPASPGEGGRLM